MSALAFFDTNIFVYTDDASAPAKRRRAIELIHQCHSSGEAVISTQVMQEYYVTATRKLSLDAAFVQKKVEIMSRMRVVELNAMDITRAIDLHRLHQVSFWDALILHAASIGGAGVLYSEDLQHGASLAGVRVENPFAKRQ